MPHKQFQTCHAIGVIDADLSRSMQEIVKKGLLGKETE